MSPRIALWLIIILLLGGIFVNLPALPLHFGIPQTPINIGALGGNFPIKLGLDLQGGSQLVLQTDMSKILPQDRDQALESARQVIERRVNLYGVSEAVVQSSQVGDQRRILVD